MQNIVNKLKTIEDGGWSHYSYEIDIILQNNTFTYNEKEILKILSFICTLELNIDKKECIYCQYINGQVKDIKIDENQVNRLFDLLQYDELHYKIKSRLSDILWLKLTHPNKIDYARIAIENYKKYPLTYSSKNEFDRAISLLISINQNLDEIKEKLFSTFESTNEIDIFFIDFITKYNKKLNFDNLVLIKILDNKIASFKKYYEKMEILEKYIQLYPKTQIDSKYNDLINYCEKTIFENDINEDIAYGKIIHWLNCIKKENHKEYNVQARLNKFQNKKIQYQKNIYCKPTSSNLTLNISQYILKSKKSIENKSLGDTLKILCHDEENLIEVLETIENEDSLSFLSGNMGVFNSDGRKVENDLTTQNIYFINYMKIIVHSKILPILNIIALEHELKEEFLLDLCKKSTIVPQDRVKVWSKGLYHGFQKDFIISTSLLVPQIENLLRVNLKKEHVNTINYKVKDGIEEEMSIDRLFLEHNKINNNVLYKKLQLILTSPFNLRHDMAHGLLNDDFLSTQLSIYFWYSTLKLIISEEEI